MLEIVANAKVNLFLEITGKLPNGYHIIDTIMQSITLSDTVSVGLLSKCEGIRLTCSDTQIPTDERNIAFKTAQAFLSESRVDCGVRIDINKCIPSQAGMGGGSADGAAVLVGLNHLCGDLFPIDKLKEIAGTYGADIPFCVDGGTQRLQGIGTDMLEKYCSPQLPIVIVKPKSGISTPSAYKLLDIMHSDFVNHKPRLPDDLIELLRSSNNSHSSLVMYNRFEETLESLCPESLQIISFIKKQGSTALLSGSGTAIFAITGDMQEAGSLERLVSEQFPDCFTYVCETASCGCLY